MSRIFITGDTHGEFSRFSSRNFPIGEKLTKDDYVIICGDVGILWLNDSDYSERYQIDWLESKSWTTLFILGNHENYDRWKAIPQEEWCGGKVQKLSPSVMRLCNGEIFTINGFTFLALSGNHSHDIFDGILEVGDPRIKEWSKDPFKMFRINRVSWWPEEKPSEEERIHILNNIAAHDRKVDYIISHALPASVLRGYDAWYFKQPNEWEQWLDANIKDKMSYKQIYSGHYHIDDSIPWDSCRFIYTDIVELGGFCGGA